MAREPKERKIPTSRAVRTATLGRVAAGQVLRQAGAKVATAGRSDEKKKVVMDRRQADAMRALVNGLGTMRGAAMKIGQALSVVDGGIIPEEVREDFQKALAQLRDSAPTVSFDKMVKVIEADLGGPLSLHFAEFGETPIAAASIGQVYRAKMHDGRDVVVKVQYPGIDKAVRADIKNLALITHALKLIAPAIDTSAMAAEIRDRIEEELDYELEAQNQRSAARLYRGHPFITVPEVITSVSGRRVLVSEYFEGIGFEAIKELDQATRNRFAEIVFRFYGAGMLQHRQFSGDPHPGNYLLGADGTVAFLDFGLYKHLDAEAVADQLAIHRAMVEGDPIAIHAALDRGGYLPDPDSVTPEEAAPILQDVLGWLVVDEEILITPDLVNEAIATVIPSGANFNVVRKQSAPADQMLAGRAIVMVMAAIGQLQASNNWHRIAREWQYGDAPVTALGIEEAESTWGAARLPATAR